MYPNAPPPPARALNLDTLADLEECHDDYCLLVLSPFMRTVSMARRPVNSIQGLPCAVLSMISLLYGRVGGRLILDLDPFLQ